MKSRKCCPRRKREGEQTGVGIETGSHRGEELLELQYRFWSIKGNERNIDSLKSRKQANLVSPYD